MNKKKGLKIIAYIISTFIIVIVLLYSYGKYMMYYSLLPSKGAFEHSAHYINPDEAFLNEGFKICDEDWIFQYYNTDKLPYPHGKNGFRDYINSNYENRNYSDSGYFNIRFIINCEGKTGRFIIHENNLDLEPIEFNPDLKTQLIELTTKIERWQPIFWQNENRDCYMYISYRIENGNITEIIP